MSINDFFEPDYLKNRPDSDDKLHHHDTAYYLYATTLAVVTLGLIICVLFQGYYVVQSPTGILGLQISAGAIFVPVTFWLSHAKGSAYVRRHSLSIIRFMLWAYTLVVIRIFVTLLALGGYHDWTKLPNPGYFIDIALWVYVILSLSIGMRQASSGKNFSPRFCPYV